MEVLGIVEDSRNIEVINYSFDDEMDFNNPDIALKWVIEKYYENGQKYGSTNIDGEFIPRPLYEYEPQSELKFVDVDVFRQSALHFKKYKTYTKLHPEYDATAYANFWDREEYRRINGMTAWAGIDKYGNRRLVYISGEFYGFLNYAPIKRTKEDEAGEVISAKVADKKKKESATSMVVKELLGKLKVPTVKAKELDFPDFIDAQYHIATARTFCKRIGKNFFYFKARRKGQSYWNGWCATNNADTIPQSTTAQVAFDIKYLNTGEKALFNMTKSYANHIWENTDWGKHRLKDNATELSFGYIVKGETTPRGYLSECLALSAGNNPDCLIGKDCIEVQVEEFGKFPNFDEMYDVTVSVTESGDSKVGFMTGWGTGGTKEANWVAAENVCYNPDSYDALACNNLWDEGAEGTACCYFYSHVHGLEGHYDYNGNTNFDTAWESHLVKKKAKRANTKTEASYMRWCGQRANCPAEAFSRDSNNIFPSEQIQAQLHFIQRNKHIKDARRCGVYVHGGLYGIQLKTNAELILEGLKVHQPVDEFPRTADTDPHGCIVEWGVPFRTFEQIDNNTLYTTADEVLNATLKRSSVPDGLYVAYQDPYAVDKNNKFITTKDSLGATYIYEMPNNITPSRGGRIVASWIGRPDSMDFYNEQTLLMLERWNAKMMFENDRGDVIPFMRKHKALHWLFPEPEMQFAKDVAKKVGRGYGMHMTTQRIEKGALYLRDKLLQKIGVNPVTGEEVFFLSTIYDEALLKELLKWNLLGNFDRTSAMIIGEYVIREVEHRTITPTKAYDSNSFFNRQLF
jgi:hypothetical protein